MDRRPLLSGTKESGTRVPQSPLLPAAQLDAALVVVEDDRDGNGAGPSSDARTSIFSSLSFAAWSDGSTGVATRNATRSTRSCVATLLLRPFQRLCCRLGDDDDDDGSSRLCSSHSCCLRRFLCCCCCCRRRSSSLSAAGMGGSDFDDVDGYDVASRHDGVAAGALRASGISQGSPRSKAGTPPTIPHVASGRGNSGRPHRQYAPPRSRSHEAGLEGTAPTLPSSPADHAGDREGGHGDSITESSLAGSSTPPSSIAFGRVAAAPGEQLVMQRGVLMRIAQDGTCTRVGDDAAAATLPDAVDGRSGSGAALWSAAQGNSPRETTLSLQADTVEAESAYALSMAIGALETARQPLRSLDQLSAQLNHYTPYLPVRVEMEVDLNSSSALSSSPTLAHTPAAASPVSVGVVPLSLHVLGPVQACPSAAPLRILEDVLVEDCDAQRMNITTLHCADLDLRNAVAGAEEPALPAGKLSSLRDAVAGQRGGQSNAFLDLLVAPAAAPSRSSKAGDASVSAAPALTAAAASAHVLTFLRSFVRARGAGLTTFHFTRCFVVPHDMGRFVPVPLSTVRRLRYERCSLTPAHVDALLTLARHHDAERRGMPGWRDGTAVSGGAFSALVELQLSGSLTSECVADLLDYIEEQQQQPQLAGGHGSRAATTVALRLVMLPSALVRAAREHRFVQAHSQYIRVVSAP